MTKTYVQKPAEVTRAWHVVDVEGKVLGQVATEIAAKLIGKHKPTFTPHVDGGDYVVVTNATKVVVTGTKTQAKLYYSYSGFPGGLRTLNFAQLLERHPEKIIEAAVYNMLPKNRLRTGRMNRLKVYPGANHTHQSQISNS